MIIMLALVYCVLWTIGGFAINKNGVAGATYVQRKVFENYLNKDYEFYNNSFMGAVGAQAIRIREGLSEYNAVIINSVPNS